MNMYHYPSDPLYPHTTYQQCPLIIDQTKDTVTNNQFEPILSQNILNLLPSDNNCKKTEEQIQNTITDKNGKKLRRKINVDTSNFSIEERLVAAVWIHERKRTKTSISQIRHDFQQRFGREPPAKNTLLVWERKLFSTGSVCDAPRPGRPVNRTSRMDEVAASMRTAPALSLRARALALRVPRTTLRAILHKDLPQTLTRNNDISCKNVGKQQNQRGVKKKKSCPAQYPPPAAPAPPAPPAACAACAAPALPPPDYT